MNINCLVIVLDNLKEEMIVFVIGSFIMLLGGFVMFVFVFTSNEMFVEVGVWIILVGLSFIICYLLFKDIVRLKRKRVK